MGPVTASGEPCRLVLPPTRYTPEPPIFSKTFGLGGRHTRITFPLALARSRGDESALRAPERGPTTAGIEADFRVRLAPPPPFSTLSRGDGRGPLIVLLAVLRTWERRR